MRGRLLNVLQTAVNARLRLAPPVSHLDVLEGVAERAAPAVADGDVALHLDRRDPLDQLEGVRSVLPELVLSREKKNGFVIIISSIIW